MQKNSIQVLYDLFNGAVIVEVYFLVILYRVICSFQSAHLRTSVIPCGTEATDRNSPTYSVLGSLFQLSLSALHSFVACFQFPSQCVLGSPSFPLALMILSQDLFRDAV